MKHQCEGGSMFQFALRDLHWLTVVAALALGWWLCYRDLCKEQQINFDLICQSLPSSSGGYDSYEDAIRHEAELAARNAATATRHD